MLKGTWNIGAMKARKREKISHYVSREMEMQKTLEK
jgi:hypothetical protein